MVPPLSTAQVEKFYNIPAYTTFSTHKTSRESFNLNYSRTYRIVKNCATAFLKHEKLKKVMVNVQKRADFPYGIDFAIL